MNRRVSIKKMTAALRTGSCALIMIVCLFQSVSASEADPPLEIQIPKDVSPALMHLLKQAGPDHQASFDPEKIIKLLNYIEAPKEQNALYFVDQKLGSPSGYYEFDLRQNLEQVLKYAFNPNVPGFLMTPSSMRFTRWKQMQARLARVGTRGSVGGGASA